MGGLWLLDRCGGNPCLPEQRPDYRVLLEQIELMNCRQGHRLRQSEVIMLWLLRVILNNYDVARNVLSHALESRVGDGGELITNLRLLLHLCFNRLLSEYSSFLTYAAISEYLTPVITHENGQEQISIIVDTDNSVNIFVLLTQPGQTLTLSLPDLALNQFTTHQQALASVLNRLNVRAGTRYQVMKVVRKGESLN